MKNPNDIKKNRKWKQLYELLSNKKYYSLNINYVSELLEIPISKLERLDIKTNGITSNRFKKKFNDHINVFIYNKVKYIGLETRRIDYELDKNKGTNWVENAIKNGYYD